MADPNRRVAIICLLCLALVPPLAAEFGQAYYVDLFTRVMIFGIAALGLDMILGYGGMVSFGHAVYLGLGGYSIGILSSFGVNGGIVGFAVAIAVSAAVAALIGAVSLHTSGVYFIMITLAFGQMFYLLGLSVEKFGGDEGLNISARSEFANILPLDNGVVFYYFVFVILIAVMLLGFRIVESRFGMVISGIKLNERRMQAIGYPTLRYKLAAFVLSGAICGLAGALLANQALFVSPAIMDWGRSGELMIMVIMGGMGTLIGPLLGAILYLVLEDTLPSFTAHWQIFLGFILLFQVLFLRWGLLGLTTYRSRRPLGVQSG